MNQYKDIYVSYLLALSGYASYIVNNIKPKDTIDDVKELFVSYDKRPIDSLCGTLTFSKSGTLCRSIIEGLNKEQVMSQYFASMMVEFLEQIPFDITNNKALLEALSISCWVLSLEERVMSPGSDYIKDFDVSLWLDLLVNPESILKNLVYLISEF